MPGTESITWGTQPSRKPAMLADSWRDLSRIIIAAFQARPPRTPKSPQRSHKAGAQEPKTVAARTGLAPDRDFGAVNKLPLYQLGGGFQTGLDIFSPWSEGGFKLSGNGNVMLADELNTAMADNSSPGFFRCVLGFLHGLKGSVPPSVVWPGACGKSSAIVTGATIPMMDNSFVTSRPPIFVHVIHKFTSSQKNSLHGQKEL